MRHDETTLSSRLSQPASSPSSLSTRARAWAGPLGMALLVALTCLAVAFYASVWLVIPYLAMMALILGVPGIGRRAQPLASSLPEHAAGSHAGRHVGDEARLVPVASQRPAVEDDGTLAEGPAEAELSSSGAELSAGSELPVLKSRRGKGRVRKAKPNTAPDLESGGVSWVRVGPGKFVRADSMALPPAPTLAVVDGAPGADDAECAMTPGSSRRQVQPPRPGGPDGRSRRPGNSYGNARG